MKLPNLFIVGAPKCGTTAMHMYLSQHPEIYMSAEKEPFYFHVSDEEKPQYSRYRENPDKYLSLFSGATTESYLGESSPGYLASPLAPEEIFTFNPQSKIIIMLRDPLDLLVSTYHHHKFMGLETRENFDNAIEEEFNHLNANAENVHQSCFYLNLCHYAKWTQAYITQFGRENVHVILYDDLRNDIYITYRQLLCFLKVDEDFVPDFKIINKRKVVRSKTLQKALVFLKLSPHQLKDNKLFIKFRSILPVHVDRIFIEQGKRLYSKENKSKAECGNKTIQLVRDHFRDEICKLEKILNRDLSRWKLS